MANKRETLIPRGERVKEKPAVENKPKEKPVEDKKDADKS
jgi:hypothetical protein